jgi:hypothetical protein
VFILKVVKVICFDTLLQVFILKGLAGAELDWVAPTRVSRSLEATKSPEPPVRKGVRSA